MANIKKITYDQASKQLLDYYQKEIAKLLKLLGFNNIDKEKFAYMLLQRVIDKGVEPEIMITCLKQVPDWIKTKNVALDKYKYILGMFNRKVNEVKI